MGDNRVSTKYMLTLLLLVTPEGQGQCVTHMAILKLVPLRMALLTVCVYDFCTDRHTHGCYGAVVVCQCVVAMTTACMTCIQCQPMTREGHISRVVSTLSLHREPQ